MTKKIKLSLVAAAVAGFATSAVAAPTIGGSLAFKFEKNDSAQETYRTISKVSLKATGNVDDKISYAVSYSERSNSQSGLSSGTNGLKLSNAKFTYKGDVATVVAGRQGIATPWTTASDVIDGTQVGNGVLALFPMNNVTLVAGNFVTHNINVGYTDAANTTTTIVDSDSDITVLAAMAKMEQFNAELWYANIAESENFTTASSGASAFTLAASTKVKAVSLSARYSSFDPDTDAVDTQSLLTLSASGKVGEVTVKGSYAKAGKDGGLVNLDLGGANSANFAYAGAWNITLGGSVDGDKDASLMGIGASMPFNNMFTGSLNYAVKSSDYIDDQAEIKAQVSAKVAKGLSLYLRGASVTSDTGADATEYVRTRLFAAYKF